MRTFNVSVDGDKVACHPETMHAPRGYEEIAICLDKKSGLKYELSVSIGEDPGNALTYQMLTPSVTVLQNDNRAPNKAKFNIGLEPLAGSNAPDLVPLDPHIVNE